jgi:hypothetical protein
MVQLKMYSSAINQRIGNWTGNFKSTVQYSKISFNKFTNSKPTHENDK